MKSNDSLDPQEIAKFTSLANEWWDKKGALKTLHDINPCRMEFIEQHMNLSTQHILDVGCGGGILSEALAEKKAIVTGLDVDESIIQVAKTHAASQALTINYVCKPLEKFKHASFDAVTCMEMLEHVQNPQLIIDNCARLLNPGGLLFLSTINRTLQAYLTVVVAAEYLFKLLPKQTHDYQKFIKPSELATMARSAGFEVIDIKGIDYNPLSHVAQLKESVAGNYLLCCQKK